MSAQDDYDMASSREHRGFHLLFLRLLQFTAIVAPGTGHGLGRHIQFRTLTFGLRKAGLIHLSTPMPAAAQELLLVLDGWSRKS